MKTHLHLAKVKNGWTYTSVPPQAGTGAVLPLLAAAEERRGMALCCAIECTHWQIALV